MPTETDVGSTLAVLVTATDANGISLAVSRPTAPVEPEALVKFSQPSIYGTVETEGILVADPGIWSGSGPVTYTYQWERCNYRGECAPIENEVGPIYIPTSIDIGSSLRVEVTATNPLGSRTALSAPTVVLAAGEASVEAAQEIALQTDPELLAPATRVTLEGQTVAPGFADGEELSSQQALTSSAASKETPGEFAKKKNRKGSPKSQRSRRRRRARRPRHSRPRASPNLRTPRPSTKRRQPRWRRQKPRRAAGH